MMRMNLQKHLNNCEYRIIACEYCATKVAQVAMEVRSVFKFILYIFERMYLDYRGGPFMFSRMSSNKCE